jgi:hypothetical protein
MLFVDSFRDSGSTVEYRPAINATATKAWTRGACEEPIDHLRRGPVIFKFVEGRKGAAECKDAIVLSLVSKSVEMRQLRSEIELISAA